MFSGAVIKGDGIGKRLGYPTANLNIKKEALNLAHGVYAARAVFNGAGYQAALVVQEKPCKVEAHLLDYTGPDFYGAYLEIEPLRQISKMQKCRTKEELIKKIKKDIEKIKKMA